MNHLEIAVYGKGGIGKSTVSANLTAALACRGLKILQIGCDPKHDSTRLLMKGETIPTVLDVLKAKGRDGAVPSDVLREGSWNVGCIEAGGPTPGVGCAGRGIISAFEFLDQYHLREQYDRVIYDVLGDVVCGGFAVPVRREYADAVFLVTSGEYMALYAANNILRGIRSFDGENYSRVAGIIFNERCLEDEDGRVRRFAQAVNLPILAKVPRSEAFARAEQRKCTVMELEDAKAEQKVFSSLAEMIASELTLHKACPLTDEQLEQTVLGTEFDGKQGEAEKSGGAAVDLGAEIPSEDTSSLANAPNTSPSLSRAPLYGCAFNGAASAAVHLTDAIIIAHGPRACAFYTLQTISSPGKKNIFNRGVLTPAAISPNFTSTDITHKEAVFGGMELLREAVQKALDQKPGAVIVISTCVSGIIGDDLPAVEDMSTENTPVIAIMADGDIAGDYMKGIQMMMETLVDRLVFNEVEVEPYTVNIIGETGIATNGDSNYQVMERLLGAMGIRVNCRFLGGTEVAQVRKLKAAPLNILASDTGDAHLLKQYLIQKHHCTFMEEPLPIGYQATADWVRSIGRFFGKEKEAEELLVKEKAAHDRETERLRRYLAGRKVVLTTINTGMDWLLDTASAAGLEFAYIGIMNYLRTPLVVTAHPERYPMMEETMDIGRIGQVIRESKPDIILSAYTSTAEDEKAIVDSIPMIPDLGVMSAVKMLDRWVKLMKNRRKGAWERDKALFEKYFS